MTALATVEVGTHLAVVTDILKIKFGATAHFALALRGRKSFFNQFPGCFVSSQVEGRVATRIFHCDIATATHETFEDAERFGI